MPPSVSISPVGSEGPSPQLVPFSEQSSWQLSGGQRTLRRIERGQKLVSASLRLPVQSSKEVVHQPCSVVKWANFSGRSPAERADWLMFSVRCCGSFTLAAGSDAATGHAPSRCRRQCLGG